MSIMETLATSTLSAPLMPPGVDLTGLPYMPLYIERLRKSKAWLACKRRPELAYYQLNLWTRAFHEPGAAGSIENDDDVLADAAGADPDTWAEVRSAVLRGWVPASDGRLYHPVIAEIALESWLEVLVKRLSGTVGNAKRWGAAVTPAAIERQMEEAAEFLARLNPQSRALAALAKRKAKGGAPERAGNPEGSRCDHDAIPEQSHRDPIAIAPRSQCDPAAITAPSHRDRNRTEHNRTEQEEPRIGKPKAGGRPRVPAREAAGPPPVESRDRAKPAEPATGSVSDDGRAAASAVVRDGLTGAFEQWFDLPDRPLTPADDDLIADWLTLGCGKGLSPADAAEAVLEEIRRQFRQMSAREAGPPRSLKAVLDKDIKDVLASVRPSAPRTPLPEVPEPYRGHLSAQDYASWIAPCDVVVAGKEAFVTAPSKFIADWLAARLEAALCRALGVRSIVVTTAPSTKPSPIPHPVSERA